MSLELIFTVTEPDDESRKLWGYTDTVRIIVESGDPGGDPGEFQQFMLEIVKEWWNCAEVTPNDLGNRRAAGPIGGASGSPTS